MNQKGKKSIWEKPKEVYWNMWPMHNKKNAHIWLMFSICVWTYIYCLFVENSGRDHEKANVKKIILRHYMYEYVIMLCNIIF